ncbi:MAG: Rab family GTPase [Candidatus Helarchaeota archaeon]
MGTYKLKLLLLGAVGTGKTEIIKRFVRGSFQKDYKMTIGCDIFTKDVRLNNGEDVVTLSIWDIAAQERFEFFRSSFYRGSAGALIFIDLTRYTTFNPTLVNIIREVWSYTGRIPLAVCGAKAELANMRSVRLQDIQAFVEYVPCEYFENLDHMNAIFEHIANEMLQNVRNLNFIMHPLSYSNVSPEFLAKSKEILKITINEMGFIIKGDFVEIINEHGVFCIDIMTGTTYFESIKCSDCEYREECKSKTRKSLCIVRMDGTPGWSNTELQNLDLLILSKIYAISENKLPDHVLQQMSNNSSCLKKQKKIISIPTNQYIRMRNQNLEVNGQPPRVNNRKSKAFLYNLMLQEIRGRRRI